MDFINRFIDGLVDFTGPYVAMALLAVVMILILYRLMGRF